MARTIKCDRCGAESATSDGRGYLFLTGFRLDRRGYVVEQVKIDLCQFCATRLKAFLAGGDADADG